VLENLVAVSTTRSSGPLFLVRLRYPIKKFVVATLASDRKMSIRIAVIQFLSTAIAEMMPASCANHLMESKIKIKCTEKETIYEHDCIPCLSQRCSGIQDKKWLKSESTAYLLVLVRIRQRDDGCDVGHSGAQAGFVRLSLL